MGDDKSKILESATLALFYYDNGTGDILSCVKQAKSESTLSDRLWLDVQSIILDDLHSRYK